MTGISTRAVFERPVERRTIIRLAELKRRMGSKVELFDDKQLLGFDRGHWEKKVFAKYPMDLSQGFKKDLGRFITTTYNQKLRSLLFSVNKKSTVTQMHALIGYIESKCPPIKYCSVFIKQKTFAELQHIDYLDDIFHYLQNVLRSTKSVIMKVTW